jgi:AraC-like DNA-binding protein
MKSAKSSSLPHSTRARLRQIGLDRPRVTAFGFADDLHNVAYDWHSHAYHQLLYSFSGIARLETKSQLWILPPQRAAWIPARTRHRTTLHHVTAGSIYLAPTKYHAVGLDQISIFTATPLLREMISYGMRWTNRPRRRDPLAESFFHTVELYCRELSREELPYSLPQGQSSAVRAAIDYTLAHLDDLTLAKAARAAAQSQRTLRRHFRAETGLTWRNYLTRARLLRAMELLSAGKHNVTESALRSGFTNLSAFSKSFRQFTHQSPAAFRRAHKSP